MSKLDDDLSEIEAFVRDLRFLSGIGLSEHNRQLFRSAYKQFHALLVWGEVAEAQVGGLLPLKTYFRETLSDISHGFVMTLLHFYKPARLSMRSGVENLIRSLLLIRGVDATGIHAVHELFNRGKSHFSAEAAIANKVIQLEQIYGDLCKTVHSAKIDYMSLTVPFERLSIFQTTRYTSNMIILRNVSSAANQAVFGLWYAELKKAGHVNEDLVRDAVPRTLKRAVHASLI